MAGIFGFLNNSDSLNPQFIAKTLRDRAKGSFSYPSNSILFDNRRACLGFAAPYTHNSWPLKSRDGNFIFQIFGEIFLPDGSLLSATNFDHNFLYPFNKSPNNFLRSIDGNFVFALYDKIRKQMYLGNDPFGNFPVHYCNNSDLFIFSTQIHAITEVLKQRQWDEQGFSEYIGLGYTLNGKTYYKDIRRLQPSEMLTISSGKVVSTKYYIPKYNHNNQLKNNVKTIKNAISSSILKRIVNNDSVGAALTGGFDSRVTWAIINSLNYKDRVIAFTHGLEKSRDITVANRISKKLALNHISKIFDMAFIKQLPAKWDHFIDLTEGMIPVTAASAVDSWKLGSCSFELLIDSIGGTLFRRQFMKVSEKTINKRQPFSDQLFDRIKSPLLKFDILDPEIRNSAILYSKKAMRDYFDNLNQINHPGDKIDLFYINAVYANRYSFAGNAQMNWIKLAHPFLNLPSFEAVQKIPPKYRRNHSIYRYILNSTFPALKSFYVENMGLPAPYLGFIYLRYVPMIYELVLQKSIRPLSSSLYQGISLRKVVTDYDMFFRINVNQIKEILLRPNSNFFSLINRDQLELLLKNVFNNISMDSSQLSSLITLKLFYDRFQINL